MSSALTSWGAKALVCGGEQRESSQTRCRLSLDYLSTRSTRSTPPLNTLNTMTTPSPPSLPLPIPNRLKATSARFDEMATALSSIPHLDRHFLVKLMASQPVTHTYRSPPIISVAHFLTGARTQQDIERVVKYAQMHCDTQSLEVPKAGYPSTWQQLSHIYPSGEHSSLSKEELITAFKEAARVIFGQTEILPQALDLAVGLAQADEAVWASARPETDFVKAGFGDVTCFTRLHVLLAILCECRSRGGYMNMKTGRR
jgi:hypothetical protein